MQHILWHIVSMVKSMCCHYFSVILLNFIQSKWVCKFLSILVINLQVMFKKLEKFSVQHTHGNFHSGEHVLSLFFSDLTNFRPECVRIISVPVHFCFSLFQNLVLKMCRLCNVFGSGANHRIHAQFMTQASAVNNAQQKKGCYTTVYGFFYNAGMPDLSYTTSYTKICERMTFLWLSYTNQKT